MIEIEKYDVQHSTPINSKLSKCLKKCKQTKLYNGVQNFLCHFVWNCCVIVVFRSVFNNHIIYMKYVDNTRAYNKGLSSILSEV